MKREMQLSKNRLRGETFVSAESDCKSADVKSGFFMASALPEDASTRVELPATDLCLWKSGDW